MGLWDADVFDAYLETERPDAVVFTFEPTLLQARLGGSHTYVETRGAAVGAVHIKHKPEGDVRGLAGFFWFRNGAVFEELDQIPDDPGRELCADHVLRHMVAKGQKVGAFALDAYVHLGSPTELREFAFWTTYCDLFDEPNAQAASGAPSR